MNNSFPTPVSSGSSLSPILFVQDIEPTSAKTGDIWLDTINNIFKKKKSDGTWGNTGATYN